MKTGDMLYDRKFKRWVQRPESMSKMDKVSVTVEVAWEAYKSLKKPIPKEEIVRKSTTASIEGVADTGCTTLSSSPELIRKLRILASALMQPDITLRTADRTQLTILGTIPFTVKVVGSKSNSTTFFLHIASELSRLFLSKLCLRELNIISKRFSLPQLEEVQAVSSTGPARLHPPNQANPLENDFGFSG